MFWMLISCKFLFNIITASLSFSCSTVNLYLVIVCRTTYNIDDDAREQLALLVLVWIFLEDYQLLILLLPEYWHDLTMVGICRWWMIERVQFGGAHVSYLHG